MLRLMLSVAAVLSVLMLGLTRADDAKKSIDSEGFIRVWLVLAPIPFADGEGHGDGVEKDKIKDEAKVEPREGDKLKVGDKELTWKKVECEDYFVDLNKALGAETENSVGYAVTYVVADAEKKNVTLKIGSDDGCKVYLNGKEVAKVTDERPLEKDQNSFDNLTLKKGTNVLVFKIVNSGIDWSGCARFTDADGKPVAGLTATVKK